MSPPDGKYLFGVVKVSEKGQIVIPKDAREVFGIRPGDSLVMLGDINQGLALIKTEKFTKITSDILDKLVTGEAEGNDGN